MRGGVKREKGRQVLRALWKAQQKSDPLATGRLKASGLLPDSGLRVPAGVAQRLLTLDAPLLGRLDVEHVLAVLAQDFAAVDGALEAPQHTVDRLVLAYFDAYTRACQGCSSGLVSGIRSLN